MDKVSVALRVFFEEPFWVGILERTEGDEMRVCKITFGPEPRDYEVQEFLTKNYYRLQFSPAVAAAAKTKSAHQNPKRVLRQVRRQMGDTGLGTKSQQALKMQQEQVKTERKADRRKRCEAEKKLRFELKQQKKKEKHRGR